LIRNDGRAAGSRRSERGEEKGMELKEFTLSSRTVYEGKIVTVKVDQARLPNGETALREVVEHPGGVCVLALREDGMVPLVRQFRYPLSELLLELPAGKLERGEQPRPAAARELEEEAGLAPEELTELGAMYVSPGFCTEKLHLYLARKCRSVQAHPDEDEFLDVIWMDFDRLVEQVMEGQIQDGKTVAAVLKTRLLLEREKGGTCLG